MIYHILFRNSGGITTYVQNLIAGNPKQQEAHIYERNTYQNVSSNLKNLTLEDTIVYHDPILFRANLCKHKSKSIVALHGDSPYYYNASEEFGYITDGFIAVSKNIKSKLNKRFHDKTLVLGPSIENHADKYFNNTSYSHLKLIFVGREDNNKGVNLLPQIDKALTDKGLIPQWTIVLGSRPEKHPKFRTWLSSSTRITLHESMPNKHLQILLAEHSALILPSESEGHPMVVIEALQFGVAPFTLKYCADCNSHFPADSTGIVTPLDSPELLASKVAQYFSQSLSMREEWQRSAVRFVQENHSPTKQFNQLYRFSTALKPSSKSHTKLALHKWYRRLACALGIWD